MKKLLGLIKSKGSMVTLYLIMSAMIFFAVTFSQVFWGGIIFIVCLVCGVLLNLLVTLQIAKMFK